MKITFGKFPDDLVNFFIYFEKEKSIRISVNHQVLREFSQNSSTKIPSKIYRKELQKIFLTISSNFLVILEFSYLFILKKFCWENFLTILVNLLRLLGIFSKILKENFLTILVNFLVISGIFPKISSGKSHKNVSEFEKVQEILLERIRGKFPSDFIILEIFRETNFGKFA